MVQVLSTKTPKQGKN